MTFKIEWPTGYMDLEVGQFFGTANKRQVGKALRLARQYCSDTERLTLIDYLNKEIAARTEVLDICGELEYKREQALRPFFGLLSKPPLPPQEKLLLRQRDQMTRYVEVLAKARWG